MKKIKFILLFIFLFLVAREFLPFEINHYKSFDHHKSSYNNNWQTISIEEKTFPNLDGPPNLNENPNYHIIIKGLEDETTTNTNYDNVLYAEIDSLNIDVSAFRYIPLVKHINYHQNIPYKFDGAVIYKDQIFSLKNSGEITINGTFKAYGLCSGRKTKELVEAQITNEIKTQLYRIVGDYINSL